MVEVPALPDPVVGFEDCVEEVGEDDCGLDSLAVFLVAGRAWLGLGVAGADGDAVVDCLNPAADQLEVGEKSAPGFSKRSVWCTSGGVWTYTWKECPASI